MDELAQAFIPLGRIDLAREADFSLDAMRVRPSRREVEYAGMSHLLQRRVMQVLVALTHSNNEVVSQKELVLRCWNGLSVSEDAIGRCIAELRRLAASWPEPPFRITTIAGVGYRLEVTSAAADREPRLPDRFGGPRMAWIAAGGVAALLVLTGAWGLAAWLDRPLPFFAARPHGARFAVLPFKVPPDDPAARAFADGLDDRIVSELSNNQLLATRPQGGSSSQAPGAADLLLDGDIRSLDKALDVSIHLEDAHEHVVVWSGHFQGPASEADTLQADVAAHAADVAEWAKLTRRGRAGLNAAATAAFIAGRESTIGIRGGSPGVARSYYQQVVDLAPDFSWGHSGKAVSDGFDATGPVSSAEREALRQDARREARRALALDAHNGEAYLALDLALPLHDWQGREAFLLQGAAADPGFEPGALMEGRLLWIVGRGHDALPWLQRAHDLDPLHNGATWSLALSLAAEGRPTEARAVVRQMESAWPEHRGTKDARFWVGLLTQPAPAMLALLADPAARPGDLGQRAADAWRAALSVRASGDPAAKANAARQVVAAADVGALGHGEAMTLLAMLGDLDDAFVQAQGYEPLDPYTAPYLFLPVTAPMRADPRFMTLAARLGLVSYWRQTGRWPDFCHEPDLPYDCRREAAEVAARSGPALRPSGGR